MPAAAIEKTPEETMAALGALYEEMEPIRVLRKRTVDQAIALQLLQREAREERRTLPPLRLAHKPLTMNPESGPAALES